MLLELPEEFKKTIVDCHGLFGIAWLEKLPDTLDEFSVRWGLTFGEVFPLSYNFVIEAFLKDGSPAVLKAGVPGIENLMEISALELYAGNGIARLLETDSQSGFMLLERISPGRTLKSFLTQENDDWATQIAAEVILKLFVPLPTDAQNILPLEDWTKGLLTIPQNSVIPLDLAETARSLRVELLASTPANEIVLLHGDLHHENILLSGSDEWIAIDPKGVSGDRAYEICSLLQNPMPELLHWGDFDRRLDRRLSILSETLQIDRERLRSWGVVHSTLSAWWSVEDGGLSAPLSLRVGESLLRMV